MEASNLLTRNLESSIDAKQQLISNHNMKSVFQEACEKTLECYKKGGRLFIAGNGGSAADAQHLAAEFVSKLARDRDPLPAEALTVDTSILTAIGNDYGYEKVFERQIRAKASANDIFLGITTSGNSPNILNAFAACEEMGIKSIAFTGKEGGMCAKSCMADYMIIAPGETTGCIQEIHIVLAHTLCEFIEDAIFTSH